MCKRQNPLMEFSNEDIEEYCHIIHIIGRKDYLKNHVQKYDDWKKNNPRPKTSHVSLKKKNFLCDYCFEDYVCFSYIIYPHILKVGQLRLIDEHNKKERLVDEDDSDEECEGEGKDDEDEFFCVLDTSSNKLCKPSYFDSSERNNRLFRDHHILIKKLLRSVLRFISKRYEGHDFTLICETEYKLKKQDFNDDGKVPYWGMNVDGCGNITDVKVTGDSRLKDLPQYSCYSLRSFLTDAQFRKVGETLACFVKFPGKTMFYENKSFNDKGLIDSGVIRGYRSPSPQNEHLHSLFIDEIQIIKSVCYSGIFEEIVKNTNEKCEELEKLHGEFQYLKDIFNECDLKDRSVKLFKKEDMEGKEMVFNGLGAESYDNVLFIRFLVGDGGDETPALARRQAKEDNPWFAFLNFFSIIDASDCESEEACILSYLSLYKQSMGKKEFRDMIGKTWNDKLVNLMNSNFVFEVDSDFIQESLGERVRGKTLVFAKPSFHKIQDEKQFTIEEIHGGIICGRIKINTLQNERLKCFMKESGRNTKIKYDSQPKSLDELGLVANFVELLRGKCFMDTKHLEELECCNYHESNLFPGFSASRRHYDKIIHEAKRIGCFIFRMFFDVVGKLIFDNLNEGIKRKGVKQLKHYYINIFTSLRLLDRFKLLKYDKELNGKRLSWKKLRKNDHILNVDQSVIKKMIGGFGRSRDRNEHVCPVIHLLKQFHEKYSKYYKKVNVLVMEWIKLLEDLITNERFIYRQFQETKVPSIGDVRILAERLDNCLLVLIHAIPLIRSCPRYFSYRHFCVNALWDIIVYGTAAVFGMSRRENMNKVFHDLFSNSWQCKRQNDLNMEIIYQLFSDPTKEISNDKYFHTLLSLLIKFMTRNRVLFNVYEDSCRNDIDEHVKVFLNDDIPENIKNLMSGSDFFVNREIDIRRISNKLNITDGKKNEISGLNKFKIPGDYSEKYHHAESLRIKTLKCFRIIEYQLHEISFNNYINHPGHLYIYTKVFNEFQRKSFDFGIYLWNRDNFINFCLWKSMGGGKTFVAIYLCILYFYSFQSGNRPIILITTPKTCVYQFSEDIEKFMKMGKIRRIKNVVLDDNRGDLSRMEKETKSLFSCGGFLCVNYERSFSWSEGKEIVLTQNEKEKACPLLGLDFEALLGMKKFIRNKCKEIRNCPNTMHVFDEAHVKCRTASFQDTLNEMLGKNRVSLTGTPMTRFGDSLSSAIMANFGIISSFGRRGVTKENLVNSMNRVGLCVGGDGRSDSENPKETLDEALISVFECKKIIENYFSKPEQSRDSTQLKYVSTKIDELSDLILNHTELSRRIYVDLEEVGIPMTIVVVRLEDTPEQEKCYQNIQHLVDSDEYEGNLSYMEQMNNHFLVSVFPYDFQLVSSSSLSDKKKIVPVSPKVFPDIIPSNKLCCLFRIISFCIKRNLKVIICAVRNENVDLLKLCIKSWFKRKVFIIRGGDDIKKRNKTICNFRNSPNTEIMLLSVECGCYGVNLQCVGLMIVMNFIWVWAVLWQSFGRIRRPGAEYVPTVVILSSGKYDGDLLCQLSLKRNVFLRVFGLDKKAPLSLSPKDVLTSLESHYYGQENEGRNQQTNKKEEEEEEDDDDEMIVFEPIIPKLNSVPLSFGNHLNVQYVASQDTNWVGDYLMGNKHLFGIGNIRVCDFSSFLNSSSNSFNIRRQSVGIKRRRRISGLEEGREKEKEDEEEIEGEGEDEKDDSCYPPRKKKRRLSDTTRDTNMKMEQVRGRNDILELEDESEQKLEDEDESGVENEILSRHTLDWGCLEISKLKEIIVRNNMEEYNRSDLESMSMREVIHVLENYPIDNEIYLDEEIIEELELSVADMQNLNLVDCDPMN